MNAHELAHTTFLNVDLDLRCPAGFDELLGHLESLAVVLHRAADRACVELNVQYDTPEECLRQFIALIQSLPERAKTIWDSCDLRSFNVGIQGGTEPYSACFAISPGTLALLAALHAEIAITVYAPYREGATPLP